MIIDPIAPWSVRVRWLLFDLWELLIDDVEEMCSRTAWNRHNRDAFRRRRLQCDLADELRHLIDCQCSRINLVPRDRIP